MHDLSNLKIKIEIMLNTNYFIDLSEDETFNRYFSSPFDQKKLLEYLKILEKHLF
jgi:hypothetical protein